MRFVHGLPLFSYKFLANNWDGQDFLSPDLVPPCSLEHPYLCSKQKNTLMKDLLQEFASMVAAKMSELANASRLESRIEKSSLNLQYYTIEEVCRMLRISRATFYRHRRDGLIMPSRFAGRRPLFTHSDIESYLRQSGLIK